MPKFLYIVSFFLVVFIASCTDSNSKTAIEKSNIQYEKPETSNQVIEGNEVEYKLWYNDKMWKLHGKKDPISKTIDQESKNRNRLLSNTSNDVYVSIEETREISSYEESFKHYAKWITRQGGQIVDKEIRNVNGQDILFIKSMVKSESKPLISINYVLTNKSGGVSITAAVSEKLFELHKLDIFDILNGLVDPSTNPNTSS